MYSTYKYTVLMNFCSSLLLFCSLHKDEILNSFHYISCIHHDNCNTSTCQICPMSFFNYHMNCRGNHTIEKDSGGRKKGKKKKWNHPKEGKTCDEKWKVKVVTEVGGLPWRALQTASCIWGGIDQRRNWWKWKFCSKSGNIFESESSIGQLRTKWCWGQLAEGGTCSH